MPFLSFLLDSCSRSHLDRKPPTAWWPSAASIPALTHRRGAHLFDKWELDGIFAANCLWVSSQCTCNHYKCSEIICTAEQGRLWSACSQSWLSLQHFLQADMRHDATIPEAISNHKCTNAPTAETLPYWFFYFYIYIYNAWISHLHKNLKCLQY